MKETNTMLILVVILIMSLMCNFYLYFLREPMIKENKIEVIKKDTIFETIRDYDTVYVTDTKYNDIYHYDTIHINDTITNTEKVYIRDTIHNYAFNEKDYDLDINAVRLDNYKLDIHARDTITYTETIYQTIYKPRRNLISIGVNAGYGYGFKSRLLEPYVGIGINLNLFRK